MRLFVALNLPEPVRRELSAATRPLRESGLPVRWVAEDAYHLTLKFLGEVAEQLAARVGDALRASARRHGPFPLRCHGTGAFPDLRRPAVWWLGCTAPAELVTLQQDVEREVSALGFPAEQRPFSPHLTLGRTERAARPGALASAGARLQGVAFDRTITVETLDLMRSHLSPRGARYERVLAVPLGS